MLHLAVHFDDALGSAQQVAVARAIVGEVSNAPA